MFSFLSQGLLQLSTASDAWNRLIRAIGSWGAWVLLRSAETAAASRARAARLLAACVTWSARGRDHAAGIEQLEAAAWWWRCAAARGAYAHWSRGGAWCRGVMRPVRLLGAGGAPELLGRPRTQVMQLTAGFVALRRSSEAVNAVLEQRVRAKSLAWRVGFTEVIRRWRLFARLQRPRRIGFAVHSSPARPGGKMQRHGFLSPAAELERTSPSSPARVSPSRSPAVRAEAAGRSARPERRVRLALGRAASLSPALATPTPKRVVGLPRGDLSSREASADLSGSGGWYAIAMLVDCHLRHRRLLRGARGWRVCAVRAAAATRLALSVRATDGRLLLRRWTGAIADAAMEWAAARRHRARLLGRVCRRLGGQVVWAGLCATGAARLRLRLLRRTTRQLTACAVARRVSQLRRARASRFHVERGLRGWAAWRGQLLQRRRDLRPLPAAPLLPGCYRSLDEWRLATRHLLTLAATSTAAAAKAWMRSARACTLRRWRSEASARRAASAAAALCATRRMERGVGHWRHCASERRAAAHRLGGATKLTEQRLAVRSSHRGLSQLSARRSDVRRSRSLRGIADRHLLVARRAVMSAALAVLNELAEAEWVLEAYVAGRKVRLVGLAWGALAAHAAGRRRCSASVAAARCRVECAALRSWSAAVQSARAVRLAELSYCAHCLRLELRASVARMRAHAAAARAAAVLYGTAGRLMALRRGLAAFRAVAVVAHGIRESLAVGEVPARGRRLRRGMAAIHAFLLRRASLAHLVSLDTSFSPAMRAPPISSRLPRPQQRSAARALRLWTWAATSRRLERHTQLLNRRSQAVRRLRGWAEYAAGRVEMQQVGSRLLSRAMLAAFNGWAELTEEGRRMRTFSRCMMQQGVAKAINGWARHAQDGARTASLVAKKAAWRAQRLRRRGWTVWRWRQSGVSCVRRHPRHGLPLPPPHLPEGLASDYGGALPSPSRCQCLRLAWPTARPRGGGAQLARGTAPPPRGAALHRQCAPHGQPRLRRAAHLARPL